MQNRLMYITESSGYGGAEQYLVYLAQEMRERAEVSVALPYKECNAKFRATLNGLGVKTIDLPQPVALYPISFLLALLFFLRHRSSLVHFSLPYPDSCRWVLLAAALLRRRYVITEHLVPPDPFKAGIYFAVTHLLFNGLKKISYRRAQGVSAVSKGNRDVLVKNYGMPQAKMTVIHNGIDCSRFATAGREQERRIREELRIEEASLVLASVGRLATQKGHSYLLAALQILARQGFPLTLVLVGDGPLRGALEQEARERGVAHLVRFAGFREDVPAIFAITDIFVMASLNEGFPLTLLEAMAAGKPVVTTRVTGTDEAIVDGDTGLLCTAAAPEELAEKVLALVSDRPGRILMGERAREAALREFDVSVMLKKTRRFYEEGAACAGV